MMQSAAIMYFVCHKILYSFCILFVIVVHMSCSVFCVVSGSCKYGVFEIAAAVVVNSSADTSLLFAAERVRL